MNTNKAQSPYQLVIFDLDGTLLDTSEGIIEAIKQTIQYANYQMIPDKKLREFIGPPIQDSFAKTFNIPREEAMELATYFRNIYKQDTVLFKAKPYDGIYDLLDTLTKKGISLAVATNKREDYAFNILNHFGFDKFTTHFYGSDFEGILKKENIIENCLKENNITDYKTALMIGDTYNDALGANKIGTSFLGVLYGFGFVTKEDINRYPNIGYAKTSMEILTYFE